jgi:formate/nitrite transporter FocA (FNT family)
MRSPGFNICFFKRVNLCRFAAVGIASMKCALPFGVAFTKGVLCNWLVCLAVWGTMVGLGKGGVM